MTDTLLVTGTKSDSKVNDKLQGPRFPMALLRSDNLLPFVSRAGVIGPCGEGSGQATHALLESRKAEEAGSGLS